MRSPHHVFSLLLSLWSSSAHAEVARIDHAIVGGQVLVAQRVSPTALIGTCDGTLIAPHLLVTAAHCMWNDPTTAWFGPSQRNAVLSVEISHCVPHPDFETSPEGNDIAFCVLRGDTSAVHPAVLVEPDEEGDEATSVGAALTLVGHGYTGAAADQRIARWVDVRIGEVLREGRELVVGDSEHGACHGDSGGSAFMTRSDGSTRLVGVVSRRGPSPNVELSTTCASTTLVTALRPHLDWLKEHTADSEGCALGTRSGASPLWLLALALLVRRSGVPRS